MNAVLRSERVFTGDEIRPADIIIHHDTIESVAPYGSATEAFDLGDRLITPGFVDLHSDAVEKEI